MASPGCNVITGQIIGTGAAITVSTVGMRVKALWLKSGGVEGYYQDTMADASMYKRLAAGTGSLATTNGVTPNTTHDGFQLGADADLNVAARVIDYVALCD